MHITMRGRRSIHLLIAAAAMFIAVDKTAAAQAGSPSWSVQGAASTVASPAAFQSAGVTDFPTALRDSGLADSAVEYYVVVGKPIVGYPGQYSYPFRVLTYPGTSGTVVATEIAINTAKHEALFAVGQVGQAAASPLGSISRTHGSSSVAPLCNPLLCGCNSGDGAMQGYTGAAWTDTADQLTVATDDIGNLFCEHGDTIYNEATGEASPPGGPDCAWTPQSGGSWNYVLNNGTSSAEAETGNNYHCTGGTYDCEIDWQSDEEDTYLTYYGHNDNTQIVSLGSTNCSQQYSPTYYNNP